MLEIRYNTDTKEVTGWCGDQSHFGHLDRSDNILFSNEAIVILDIPIPDGFCHAYLYDEATSTLVPNPAYSEPEPLFFEPENPALGVEQRLNRVEEFLHHVYPPTSPP